MLLVRIKKASGEMCIHKFLRYRHNLLFSSYKYQDALFKL